MGVAADLCCQRGEEVSVKSGLFLSFRRRKANAAFYSFTAMQDLAVTTE